MKKIMVASKMRKKKKKIPCSCCQYYTQNQYEKDIKKIARVLKGADFDGIWGPARGGFTPLVKLSHLLDIPYIEKPTKLSLIIDDIADTGKCLGDYAKNGHFIVTLFYHRQSVFVPNIWLREKKDKYIIFPWEKWQCVRRSKIAFKKYQKIPA